MQQQKLQDLSKPTKPSSTSAAWYSEDFRFDVLSKIYFIDAYFTSYKSKKDREYISYHVSNPVTIYRHIMYKLQHDGLHAEHAIIFKATLRSFSAGD